MYNLTFTRSRFSDVTEKRPLICTRLALDFSSIESLNPVTRGIKKITARRVHMQETQFDHGHTNLECWGLGKTLRSVLIFQTSLQLGLI